MSEDPNDEGLLRRADVRPADKKPTSVWIAQTLCAFGCAGALYFALLAGDRVTKVSMGLLGLLYIALLYGTEKRKAWSRWFLAVFMAAGAVSTFVQALNDPSGALNDGRGRGPIVIEPGDRRGVAAGQAATIVLIFLLAGRLAFGAPAKRYFGRSDEAKGQ
jgi:hypothetical protein